MPDGTYDLASMLVDELETRPGHMAEGVRMRYTFTTDQRDATHEEGQVLVVGGVSPQLQCVAGRFARFGSELRATDLSGHMSAVTLSVTSDGLVFATPGGGQRDVKAMVFRRR